MGKFSTHVDGKFMELQIKVLNNAIKELWKQKVSLMNMKLIFIIIMEKILI